MLGEFGTFYSLVRLFYVLGRLPFAGVVRGKKNRFAYCSFIPKNCRGKVVDLCSVCACGSVHGFAEPSRPRTGGSGCDRTHNDPSDAIQYVFFFSSVCVSLYRC